MFNSVVNHISDVDLDNTPESKLDGEHFLIKASPEALNENQQSEPLKSSFGAVTQQEMKVLPGSKKRKYARRVIKKTCPAQEAKQKLKEREEKHD